MRHIIEVGDMKVGHEEDLLVSHSLGSCLGLMVYDPAARIGGLLRAMLPLSKINPQKAQTNPHMFVDTGVPALFKALFGIGGQKNRMIVKAAGCGNPFGKNAIFNIGHRNYHTLKKLLWKSNVLLESEDIGGADNRTIRFDIGTGQTNISTNGNTWEL